jgi:integrase/recombinase XerD
MVISVSFYVSTSQSRTRTRTNCVPKWRKMIKYTYKFVLRTDHERKDGTYPIVLQAFIGGARVKIPMDLLVRKEEWDPNKEQAKIPKDRIRETRINTVLAKCRGRVEALFYEARMSETGMSAQTFIDEIDNKPTQASFILFIEREIENEKVDREASTVKTYVSTLNHLRAFQPAVSFSDLSFAFVQSFDRYLKGKKINDNARAKYHAVVRKFILLAQKKKKRIPNPYEEFKTRSVAAERVWLTVEEVDALAKLYRSQTLAPAMHRALRQFLFQIVSSLRVSDVRQLTRADISGDLMVITPQKTKYVHKVVKIPLSQLAKQLIREGEGKGELVFLSMPDQTVNLHLKDVAKIAGISKHLTTHVGRHTFAFLYLLMGGKVEELREILGHSKLETTLIYTHTDHDKKVAGMLKFDEILRVK